MPPARERFLALLRVAAAGGDFQKLTLGKYRGSDPTLHNLFARPVALRAGPRLSLVWRHATRDVTKNYPPPEALALLEPLIGADFLDAHLFTAAQTAQLECQPGGAARLRCTSPRQARLPVKASKTTVPSEKVGTGVPPVRRPAVGQVGLSRRSAAKTDDLAGHLTEVAYSHDAAKSHPIPATAPWLRALGVTNDAGRPREDMAPKFRQIQKFAELLGPLVDEAGLAAGPLRVVDMGCGKGYLTFAVSALFGDRARVHGVEARPELVDLCNRVAREQGWAARLDFAAGSIADTPLEPIDLLIALHACDTATDDALAKGIAAGASLLVVAPCCQKELRPQLEAPPVLADALRHGIFQERAAEFVTDALRAQLLEWAGYRAKVFEFISTEHTAKNLLIAAVKSGPGRDPAQAARLRAFAAFYGIRTQRLAARLAFDLAADRMPL